MTKKTFLYFTRSVLYLAVFLTVCDPLARYLAGPVFLRRILLAGHFTIDLIFSVEFFILLYSALREKKIRSLILSGSFWTNLLSSLPLLFFHSGLLLASSPAGKITAGAAPLACLAAAFSSFQYFRFLKWMENAGPPSDVLIRNRTGRLVGSGIRILAVLLLLGTLFQAIHADRLKKERMNRYRHALAGLENINLTMNIPLRPLLFKLFSADPTVLKMTYNEFLILSRMTPDRLAAAYERPDYSLLVKGEYRLFILTADLDRPFHFFRLTASLILLILILCAVYVFAGYLDRSVLKPVQAVAEGLASRDTLLVIRTEKAAKGSPDEITRLVQEYNGKYLPLKQRMEERRKHRTVLRLDDLTRFRKAE